MNAWQLDVIKDQMDTEAWRKLNEADPCENVLIASAKDIKEATSFMDIAENRLCEAVVVLSGTPMEDKIASFLNELQDLRIDLQMLAENYAKGVRE